jgi:regulatory protein
MEPVDRTFSHAKHQAYRFLASRARSSHELRNHLCQRGYSSKIIDNVLHELAAEGYIDDRKFALNWARYRLEKKPLGRRRLIYDLRRRGITSEVIGEILNQIYSEYDEAALAERAMLKRFNHKDLLQSVRERERCTRYLMGQGFEPDVITAILSERFSSSFHSEDDC